MTAESAKNEGFTIVITQENPVLSDLDLGWEHGTFDEENASIEALLEALRIALRSKQDDLPWQIEVKKNSPLPNPQQPK